MKICIFDQMQKNDLPELLLAALEHDKVMKSLRLFVDKVMPELRRLEIDTINYPNNGYHVWLSSGRAG